MKMYCPYCGKEHELSKEVWFNSFMGLKTDFDCECGAHITPWLESSFMRPPSTIPTGQVEHISASRERKVVE